MKIFHCLKNLVPARKIFIILTVFTVVTVHFAVGGPWRRRRGEEGGLEGREAGRCSVMVCMYEMA